MTNVAPAVTLLAGVLSALLAGFYPAKVLSSYTPALSLKGGAEQKGGEQWLRRRSARSLPAGRVVAWAARLKAPDSGAGGRGGRRCLAQLVSS